jgi:predicted CXXCH cytochrome family protein
MKRLFYVLAALLFVASISTASFAEIQGSPHDISGEDLGTSDLCIFCHVPHNPLSQSDAPLWNHSDSTQTFTFYDGSTGPATGTTMQCLSCHDGVTNIDAFGGVAGTMDMKTKFPGTTAIIGTNLQDDHPVCVAYIIKEGKFKDVSGSVAVKLFNGKVECSSCHNPHLTENKKFLRSSNANSALCLTCHDK